MKEKLSWSLKEVVNIIIGINPLRETLFESEGE